MSQHAGTIPNGSGAEVRLDIQSAIQALLSSSSGNSAPATPYQGQVWVDTNTPSSTVWNISRWSGSAWHVESVWDTVAGTITASSGPTPTKIENGTSKLEISASGGEIIATVAGNETMRWDTSRRIMTGGQTTPATGYTAVGSITLPSTAAIFALNTLKAWGTVTGGGSLSAGFNVGSISKTGTGAYTVNFSNATADANYALGFAILSGTDPNVQAVNGATKSTTQFNVITGAPYMPTSQDRAFTFVCAGN